MAGGTANHPEILRSCRRLTANAGPIQNCSRDHGITIGNSTIDRSVRTPDTPCNAPIANASSRGDHINSDPPRNAARPILPLNENISRASVSGLTSEQRLSDCEQVLLPVPSGATDPTFAAGRLGNISLNCCSTSARRSLSAFVGLSMAPCLTCWPSLSSCSMLMLWSLAASDANRSSSVSGTNPHSQGVNAPCFKFPHRIQRAVVT